MTQEDRQTQCQPDDTVPGCGSVRSKVIGDFDTEVADVPGAVFADTRDTKGAKATENRKNETSNAGRQYQFVTVKSPGVQVLEDSSTKYKCELCNQGFTRRCDKSRHKERYHTTNKPQCSDCGKIFQYKRTLMQHKQANIAGRKIQYCDQCEQKFCINRDLIQHKKQVHGCSKNFECDLCWRKYSTEFSLLRHKKESHNPKECVCPVCNKVFVSIGYLKKHISRHNNMMSTECDYCGKHLKNNDSLRSHLKRFHIDKYAEIESTKTNRQPNEEPNVNPVSEHQKGISESLEKQDMDGDLTVDKAHPVIRQPSTNTDYVDNSGMEQECDNQMKGWIATCSEWIADKSDKLYDDVFLGVNSGATVDFDDEDVADSSDKGVTGFSSKTIFDFSDESMTGYL